MSKYPKVHVRLTGGDGNAFSILGKVSGALRRAGVKEEEIDAFRKEATSGTYDKVLQTAIAWVEVS